MPAAIQYLRAQFLEGLGFAGLSVKSSRFGQFTRLEPFVSACFAFGGSRLVLVVMIGFLFLVDTCLDGLAYFYQTGLVYSLTVFTIAALNSTVRMSIIIYLVALVVRGARLGPFARFARAQDLQAVVLVGQRQARVPFLQQRNHLCRRQVHLGRRLLVAYC